MKESILKQKTYAFALKVIKVYKQIVAEHKEYVLSKQFLKAGTAPGGLVREAEYAQSKPDFISKMSIALKESNECFGLLRLRSVTTAQHKLLLLDLPPTRLRLHLTSHCH